MEIEALVKWGGYAASAAGGGWACYVKALKPMLKIFRANYNNLQAIPQMMEALDTIRKQLVPNGGASISDKLDRVETNQIIQGHRLGVALQTAKTAVVETDSRGRVVLVNEPLCMLLGRTKEDLLGNNWISVIHPEDREVVSDEWKDAVENHRNFDAHFRFVLLDGASMRVYMKMSPTPSHQERHLGYIGVIMKVPPHPNAS